MKLCCLILACGLSAPAADPSRDLLRRTMDNYMASQKRQALYLYDRSVTTKDLDGEGGVKAVRTALMRREVVEGVPVLRAVERDGKPLTAEASRKQEAGVRKILSEFRSLSPAERKAKLANSTSGRELEFLREMPEAMTLDYTRSEWRGGREILVMSLIPRPGYEPQNMQARVFAKVRGIAHIDKRDAEFVRLDAEVVENINLGGFLAKVEKGTQFHLTRSSQAEGVWLPEKMSIKFGARVMWVKTVRQESESIFSKFRLWQSD